MAGESVAGENAVSVAAKKDSAQQPSVVNTPTVASKKESTHASAANTPIPSPKRSAQDGRPRLSRAHTNPGLRMATPITSRVPATYGTHSQSTPGIMIHPNPSIRTWQRLEALRMRNLGIKSLPRSFMVARTYAYQPIEEPESFRKLPPLRREKTTSLTGRTQMMASLDDPGNGIAPFHTLEKPTCGYFFSFLTNHKKIYHGIPPANIPSWRSAHYTSS